VQRNPKVLHFCSPRRVTTLWVRFSWYNLFVVDPAKSSHGDAHLGKRSASLVSLDEAVQSQMRSWKSWEHSLTPHTYKYKYRFAHNLYQIHSLSGLI
jgi:hypothetical protein